MARPPKNGVTRTQPRRNHFMQAQTKIHQASIGNPPKDFSKQESAYWKVVIAECEYLNRSHRQWLIVCCRIAVRVSKLVKFFERREAALEKENAGDGMLAFLDNEQVKRHPLAIELANSEKTLFTAFDAIGLNMKSQAAIMRAVGASTEAQERSTLAAKYFS